MNFHNFAKQSTFYLLGNIASRAVGFLMIPVYARYLTASEYGMVELLELSIQIVVIVLGIQALGGALIRIFHDYEDEPSRSAVVSASFISTAVVGALIMLFACLSANSLSLLLFKSADSAPLIRLAFVAMFFGNMAEIAVTALRLRGRVGFVVTYSLIQLFLSLSLNVFFIVFWHMGVWGFMWSKLITSILGGTFLTILVFRSANLASLVEPLRRIAKFALPLILTGISIFVIHFSDRFFIDQMCTLQDVGIYSLAYKFGFLVTYLVGEPFGRVWNVNLYGYTAEQSWRQGAVKAARYLTASLFLVGLSISLVIPQLLPLMVTQVLAKAASVIPIIVLAYVAREIGDFFKSVLYINKRTYLVSRITIFCAVLNCVMNFILIRALGMPGAAWSTLVTWTVYMGCCWLYTEREHELQFGLKAFAQLCGLAAIIFLFARVQSWGPIAVSLTGDTLLIGVFTASIFVIKYLPREDWGNFVSYLSKVKLRT